MIFDSSVYKEVGQFVAKPILEKMYKDFGPNRGKMDILWIGDLIKEHNFIFNKRQVMKTVEDMKDKGVITRHRIARYSIPQSTLDKKKIF